MTVARPLAAPVPLETAPVLLEIGLLLFLAVAAGWLARRLRLPAVVGYMAVGVIVSPFTPGYVADRHELQVLADVGVVLLLFEVGIEINPLRLRHERGALLWAAPVQVAITTLLTAAGALALGLPAPAAVLLGVSVAMSSSVVVVNITRSRRRTTNRATDDALLGWSLVQDVTGVSLALMLLAVLGLSSRPPLAAALALVAYVLLTLAAAWLLPIVLHRLRAYQDLFLLLSVGSGLVLAGLGAQFFGVPLALAAFVSGLAIGESPAAAEARRRILPFRDLFAVLFFVLLGSLIDPSALAGALPGISLLLLGVALAKALPILLLGRVARMPQVRLPQLALGLGQVGEFSFVLASILLSRALIPGTLFTAMLAVVVLTIVSSSVLVRFGGGSTAPGDHSSDTTPS